MKTSDYELYQNLGIISCVHIVHISLITCSADRTVSHDTSLECWRMIQDKVLSDERTNAYVTTIDDIRRYWLLCKECNWYKSEQTFLSEARL